MNRPVEQVAVDCVIPTHGRPQYLAEALAAVAAQTLAPAEVVVVSDDADPRSRAVVEQARLDHPDLRLTFVERQSGPPGASASRNAGADHGSAPLVAFLDDDDRWAPTYLERAVALLDREPPGARRPGRAGPGADDVAMVVTAIQRFSDSGPGVVITPRSDLDPRGVFRSSAGVTGSSVLVRRTVFDQVGAFDPHLPVQNDRDFVLRVLDGGHRYVVQPQPLVEMRDHGHGRLTDASARRADGVLLFLAKHGSRFSWWDRRILRYTSHYTRMACARSRKDFIGSACGALVNWSPTVARNLPLRLFRVERLRSLGRKLSGRAW